MAIATPQTASPPGEVPSFSVLDHSFPLVRVALLGFLRSSVAVWWWWLSAQPTPSRIFGCKAVDNTVLQHLLVPQD